MASTSCYEVEIEDMEVDMHHMQASTDPVLHEIAADPITATASDEGSMSDGESCQQGVSIHDQSTLIIPMTPEKSALASPDTDMTGGLMDPNERKCASEDRTVRVSTNRSSDEGSLDGSVIGTSQYFTLQDPFGLKKKESPPAAIAGSSSESKRSVIHTSIHESSVKFDVSPVSNSVSSTSNSSSSGSFYSSRSVITPPRLSPQDIVSHSQYGANLSGKYILTSTPIMPRGARGSTSRINSSQQTSPISQKQIRTQLADDLLLKSMKSLEEDIVGLTSNSGIALSLSQGMSTQVSQLVTAVESTSTQLSEIKNYMTEMTRRCKVAYTEDIEYVTRAFTHVQETVDKCAKNFDNGIQIKVTKLDPQALGQIQSVLPKLDLDTNHHRCCCSTNEETLLSVKNEVLAALEAFKTSFDSKPCNGSSKGGISQGSVIITEYKSDDSVSPLSVVGRKPRQTAPASTSTKYANQSRPSTEAAGTVSSGSSPEPVRIVTKNFSVSLRADSTPDTPTVSKSSGQPLSVSSMSIASNSSSEEGRGKRKKRLSAKLLHRSYPVAIGMKYSDSSSSEPSSSGAAKPKLPQLSEKRKRKKISNNCSRSNVIDLTGPSRKPNKNNADEGDSIVIDQSSGPSQATVDRSKAEEPNVKSRRSLQAHIVKVVSRRQQPRLGDDKGSKPNGFSPSVDSSLSLTLTVTRTFRCAVGLGPLECESYDKECHFSSDFLYMMRNHRNDVKNHCQVGNDGAKRNFAVQLEGDTGRICCKTAINGSRCGFKTGDSSVFWRHFRQVTHIEDISLNNFTCVPCTAVFGDEEQFWKHLAASKVCQKARPNPDGSMDKDKPGTAVEAMSGRGETCLSSVRKSPNRRVTRKRGRPNSSLGTGSISLTCNFCCRSFVSLSDLQVHHEFECAGIHPEE